MSEETIVSIDVYAVTNPDAEDRTAKFLYTIPSNKLIEVIQDTTKVEENECIMIVQPTKSWMMYRSYARTRTPRVRKHYSKMNSVGARGTNFLTDWDGKYDVKPPSME